MSDRRLQELKREDFLAWRRALLRTGKIVSGDVHGPVSILKQQCSFCGKTGLFYSDCSLCWECCGEQCISIEDGKVVSVGHSDDDDIVQVNIIPCKG